MQYRSTRRGQRPSSHFLASVLVFCLAGALPTAKAADTPQPIAVDATFKATEQATKLFRVAEGKALKDVTKVAVPLFSVEFVTADNESAQTSGFGSTGRASTTAHYKLMGVGDPDFQAITTALYERFLADLKAAGMEVLPHEQVAASPTYKKLAAGGTPSPIKSDSAITIAPPSMPIYGVNKTQTGGNSSSASLFGALSQMGAGFGAVGAALDSVALQKELDASLIEVQMKVNFVQLTNNNKGFLGRLTDTASVEGKVSPSVGSAMFRVQSTTQGSLTLTNPLALDNAAFIEVRKKATTAGDVAGAVAIAVLQLAINSRSNSSNSSSSDEMEAVADPSRYREIVGAGLGTVTQMFVQRLKAGE
jgi:hypothetical protein